MGFKGRPDYTQARKIFEQAFYGDGKARRVIPPQTRVKGWGDHCGAVGSSWVPDIVHEVDISGPCSAHDRNYGKESTMDRADADRLLKSDIIDVLVSKGVSGIVATMTGMMYHTAVRWAGRFVYEGKGSPK